MASDFVRSLKDISNIHKLSKNLVEENDIITTTTNDHYIATKKDFHKLLTSQDYLDFNNTIKGLKSETTKNKNKIATVSTQVDTNTQSIEDIKNNQPDNVNLDEVNQKIDTNKSSIDDLTTKYNTTQTHLQDVDKKVYDYTSNLDGMNERIDKNTVDISNINERTTKLENDEPTEVNLDDINTKIATNTSDIKQIKTDQQKQSSKIDNFVTETGWKDLTLNSGITSYNDSETPQYRIIKIGTSETVYLRGAVKGIKARNTIIAKIPLNKELSQKHPFVQTCTLKYNNEKALYPPSNRWSVNTNGEIELVYLDITDENVSGTEWCPISTNFQT